MPENKAAKIHPALTGDMLKLDRNALAGESDWNVFASSWWSQSKNGIARRWTGGSEDYSQMGDKDNHNLRKLFGPEATKTNYAFHQSMLAETPAELKPWMSQRDAYRSSMLLMVKAISSVGGETGLFKAQANGWKGFQFDDPAKEPKKVTLELYDSQDRHVEIIFMTKKGAGADITQADVNRALETLKPTDPASETIPSSNSKILN